MKSITKINLSMLVEAHTSELYSWAIHKVSDKELAKDLVQETFLAAAEKLNDFKGDCTPRTWLFSILNHKIIDVYRKKLKQKVMIEKEDMLVFFDSDGNWRKEKRPLDWENETPHLLDNYDFQEILQKCLNTLPEKWKVCIQSKYINEKKTQEICQELDISATNLWQIVHRAKLHLRDCIQTKWYN